MSKVCIVTWDGGGNVPPALGIGRELKRRGHDVTFTGHEQQRGAIQDQAGFEFYPYRAAPRWDSTRPFKPVEIVHRVFVSRALGAELPPADLYLVDNLLFGALSEIQKGGRRHAVLFHSLLSEGLNTWGGGLGALLAMLHRLRPPKLWADAEATLVATLRELDPIADQKLPANVRYVGPVWQDSRPQASEAREPHVLASLSTISQDGQPAALQAVIDALGTLKVPATVTTGPAVDPEQLRAPQNVNLLRMADHGELMRRSTLVVGHGGHATTMRALAHSLPLLVIPMFEQGDQTQIGRVIERTGAGRMLPKKASSAEIATALQALLEDGSYRTAAARLGALIRERDGAAAAAHQLEALLPSRRVVSSPA